MFANTMIMWALVAVFAVLDAVGLWAEDMSLASETILPTLLPILGTGFLSWIYTRFRPDLRIGTLTHMIALTWAFTAVTMVLSYLLVGLNQPLVDDYLIASDRALGLDWPAIYRAIIAHPALYLGLKLVYLSLVPQMIVLQLIFNFRGQFQRAFELQWLFFLSCLGCLIASAFWPAMGAFGAFHILTGEPYVQEFAALRAGTLKVIGVGGVQGIIQFPSLHTALAILYIYSARGQRTLFPLLLVLNIFIIIATPTIGGHHFADVWGGAAWALLVIGLSRFFSTKVSHTTEVPALKAGT